MTKNTASEGELEKLHATLAKSFTRILDSGEYTAAELNVIRQFLKDNGINAVPAKGSPVGDLLERLPFPDPASIEAENSTMQ